MKMYNWGDRLLRNVAVLACLIIYTLSHHRIQHSVHSTVQSPTLYQTPHVITTQLLGILYDLHHRVMYPLSDLVIVAVDRHSCIKQVKCMRKAGEMLCFSSTDFFPPQLEGICCSNGLFFFCLHCSPRSCRLNYYWVYAHLLYNLEFLGCY